MQKYVNQLIEDIKNAHRVEEEQLVDSGVDIDEVEEVEDIREHFEEVERYLNSDSETEPTFAEHCGLDKTAFPPADRLSDEQKVDIYTAFEKMMQSYNAYPTIPDILPPTMAYDAFVGVLDVRLFLPKLGMVGIEFCDYEPEHCQFGEYCTCKDLEDDFKLPDEDEFEDDIDLDDIEFTEEEEQEFGEDFDQDRQPPKWEGPDSDLPF